MGEKLRMCKQGNYYPIIGEFTDEMGA